MIRIDPAVHLDVVSGVIQSKYLAILIFILALGIGIPWMNMIFNFLLTLFVYIFPFYLLFTLFINHKKGWAAALIIWMGLSLIPMQLGVGVEQIQFLFEYFPLLFLVIFCVILNFKLREWGYRQKADSFPLWF